MTLPKPTNTSSTPTVLITGGHSGIGLECSRHLAAAYGANLILAGRSPEKMQAVATELQLRGATVHLLTLDVSSLASVREAATQLIAWLAEGRVPALDALLCNAGARFMGPVAYSPEGYEQTFATNCLGHFLLTELLTDHLSERGRIVFTASGTHDPATTDGLMVGRAAKPDAQALAYAGKDGYPLPSTGVRYTTAKLCDILYAYEAARRLKANASGVSALAFDPGFVAESEFTREVPAPLRRLTRSGAMQQVLKAAGVTMGTAQFSGAALAKLAVDSKFTGHSGEYWQSNSGKLSAVRSSAQSYDQYSALKLWQDCRTLVGLAVSEGSARLQGVARLQ